MNIQYLGVKEVSGSLIVLDGVKNASYEEMVQIRLDNGEERVGRVIEIKDDIAVVQVFEGTTGISSSNTRTGFTGRALELPLSPEILGRTLTVLDVLLTALVRLWPKSVGMLTVIQPILLLESTQETLSKQVYQPLMALPL